MVNDYYVKDNSPTNMARSESLFISCKTFKTDLTKEEFRRNIDLAVRITSEFADKNKKVKVVEPIKTSDNPPCQRCGGTFFLRTGTCHVCQTCAESQGCS